ELDDVIEKRCCLPGQAFDAFGPPGLSFSPDLLVSVRERLPIVPVSLDQLFQLIAEALEKRRVFVEMYCAVLANGLLHLAGIGLRIATGVPAYMFHEIGREQLDRRDLRIDAEIDEVLVDESAHFFTDAREVDRIILVALLGHAKQVTETSGRAAVA